jgi:hypothetical protein
LCNAALDGLQRSDLLNTNVLILNTGINYPGRIKTSDSSRGHKISTRDGSEIDSDLTYKFEKLDRSSQGVFVSKNQTKVTSPLQPRASETRFIPAIFPLSELPTPQDYQPHPLVTSLAASTFTFGALSWWYR